MSLNKIFRFVVIALVLSLVSCTTSKNTFITRSFHNTCAHYNGYFWGKLAFDEGMDVLNKTHKDDYSDIIPIYPYPDQVEGPTIYPNMTRAIKKADTMIQKHTITDKAKHEIPDAVKYIKYCYLLLAEAHLYKNDLLEANDVLEYATKEYRKTDFKYEALIWQARTYNQLGSVSKSEEVLDLLRSNLKKMKKSLVPQVHAVIADWCLRTGQYEDMAKELHLAINTEKNKKVKARYYFILGQLAEKNGDNKEAFNCYTISLKLHPYDEVDFAARIKRALLYMGGSKENEDIKNNLVKMLKPTRYLDYRDQIYYALAEIAMKEGKDSMGLMYLNKSIRASTTNNRQKAISYLTIGNMDFDKENYVGAKKYYDSTLIALPKKAKGRDTILAKKLSLDRLVKNLNMITYQDSVQRIAKMGPQRAGKYVDSLIEADKKREEEERQLAARSGQGNNSSVDVPAQSNGKWYFYNPTTVAQGINEFSQHWGNRPLEDDWRRSHKAINALQAGNDAGSKTDSTGKIGLHKKDSVISKFSRTNYMKNVPFSDAQMKASNDSLIDALYNAGYIYQQYIKNMRFAAREYEELLSRFPDNKYKLIVYYQLYSMYKTMGDSRMETYKNILLTKYPDTEYALLIRDPEKYRKQQEANKEELMRIYISTLTSYQKGNYAEVMNNCMQVDSLYPKNDEAPKFAFMEAAAIGHAQGIDAYKKALEKVIILYPKDSVKITAQNILDYLNKKSKVTNVNPQAPDTNPVVYSNEADTDYSWVMLVDNSQSGKINTVKNALTDMNTKSFSDAKLQTDNLFLNSGQQMLVIKSFKDKGKAKDYYNYIINDPDLLKAIPAESYHTFYISAENFRLLYKHHKGDEYLKFFKDNIQ